MRIIRRSALARRTSMQCGLQAMRRRIATISAHVLCVLFPVLPFVLTRCVLPYAVCPSLRGVSLPVSSPKVVKTAKRDLILIHSFIGHAPSRTPPAPERMGPTPRPDQTPTQDPTRTRPPTTRPDPIPTRPDPTHDPVPPNTQPDNFPRSHTEKRPFESARPHVRK